MVRNVKDYKVVEQDGCLMEAFENRVMAEIRDGYALYGTPYGNNAFLCQAVIKVWGNKGASKE